MEPETKEYTNGEVTVVWKAHLCAHSGNCVKHLSSVFRPKEKPWVQVEHGRTEQIRDAVNKCPSGALTHR